MLMLRGGSWKHNLAQIVADAIGKSNTREELLHFLNAKGIEADFQADKVLFVLPDGKKVAVINFYLMGISPKKT